MSLIEQEAPEPQVPGAQEEPAQDPEGTPEQALEQENYLLHYRTQQDAENAIREKDSYIGRLQAELGETRQAMGQQQYLPPQDDDAFDDLVEENPEYAVQEALRRGDQLRLDRAVEAWYEIDPRRASKFERSLEQQQFLQQYHYPVQQEIGNQQLVGAFNAVRSVHPDFDQLEPAMAQAAQLAPHLLTPLTTGGLEEKRQVIETLYLMARGMQQGQAPAQAVPAPQQAPYVAQAGSSPPLQEIQKSQTELAHDRVLESLARRSELWENKNS